MIPMVLIKNMNSKVITYQNPIGKRGLMKLNTRDLELPSNRKNMIGSKFINI